MFKKIFPALSYSLLTLVAAGVAQGHGYVEKPGSRNYYCGAVTKPDEVLYGTPVYEECREAFILPDGSANNDGYNFMGILSHTKGAKYVRPLPENVCGFDSEKFGYGETLWDLPIDWPTSEMQAGSNEFIWNISYGPHFSDTEQFRYWITKPDYKFEVGKPLQWSDLEAAPFCEIEWTGESTDTLKADYDNQKFIMNCDVPARSGRHIIYGEWGRTPSTYERFHSCMDVTFGETNTTPGDTKPMVEAEFTIEPNVDVVFGSGVLVLNASQSAGTGLTYQWSYNAGNDAGYRLENANEPVAYLYYEDTTARRDLTINVTVKDDEGQQDSATKAIQHFPLYYSQWSDLGLLTPEAKTLTVGETVFLRLVLNNGQDVYYPVDGLSITEENRQADVWPYQLAQLINASEEQLKLGLLEGDRVEPQQNATSNKVFAHEALNAAAAYLDVRAAVVEEDETPVEETPGEETPPSTGASCTVVKQQGANPWWAGWDIASDQAEFSIDFSNTGIDLQKVTIDKGVFDITVQGNVVHFVKPSWVNANTPGYFGMNGNDYAPLAGNALPTCQ